MSPAPKKDWRNFEQRREEALKGQRGSGRPKTASPSMTPQVPNRLQRYENSAYQYDNYEQDLHNQGPQNYNNGRISQSANQITSAASAHRGYSPESFYPQSPIEKKRKCRDVMCLGIFILSIVLMFGVTGYAIFQGDLQRFTNGVDLNCDICGIKNEALPGVQNSGKDLRLANFLHTLKIQRTGRGMDGDDFRFPTEELLVTPVDTPPLLTVSKECVTKCPPESKVILNRCVSRRKEDQNTNISARIDTAALRIDDVTEVVEDVNSFYNEILEDLESHWKDILWICLNSLGVAILMTVLLRLFAGVIIWIVVAIVSITAIGGSIALWLLWLNKWNDKNSRTDTQVVLLLVSAAIVSILTVILLLGLFCMRKRIGVVIRLFNEAGKAVHAMPLLLFQPLLTFLALGIATSSWMIVAILIETSGNPEDGQTECQYKNDYFSIFSRWWNVVMIIWMTQFILGCQHLIIAGAVSIWFFKRDKRLLGFPLALSYKRLVRYHLGSVAFGSIIIATLKIIRYVLNTVIKRLGDTNVLCKLLHWCCKCCISCLENFLIFLNRNAYIEIAIYGYGFCKSARKAFRVIVNNALSLVAINSVGDFVLFLAKLGIVALSVFIGYELMKNREGINHIWVPLSLGGIFAYFVAHCFISVYEMVIDTVFVCFCEDCEMNDGLEKPYFMSKGLMEFLRSSQKNQAQKKRGNETK